ILEALRSSGATFFGPLLAAVGGGYPGETVDALWNLVWQGLVTNDTLHALRAFTHVRASASRRRARSTPGPAFRSRRLAPPAAEGRWSLVGVDQTVSESGLSAKTAAAIARRTAART